ncbi:hypothetical protein [Microbacterium sp. NPDC055683]
MAERIHGDPVGVVAVDGIVDGRGVMRIRLDARRENGIEGVDYVDQPTFLVLPGNLDRGVVEVDIRASIREGVSELSRGFAGIAFHISDDLSRFECVYLRPANGSKEHPPAPRDRRAIQYFSFPRWPFDRLRDERPGEFERAADIGLDVWVRLRVDISDDEVVATVDGEEVLRVARLDPAPAGAVGLFVDIGTEALFADLEISHSR